MGNYLHLLFHIFSIKCPFLCFSYGMDQKRSSGWWHQSLLCLLYTGEQKRSSGSSLSHRRWQRLWEHLQFLISSFREVASLHPECSERPEPSAVIPAPSCTEVRVSLTDRRDWVPRWIKCQPCAASRTPSPLPGARDPCVYPHCTYTVKKLWASVSTSKAALAAALEMEPDNFGYEWLVCSWGWNYCWWRSCTDGVMSSAQTGRNLSCGRTTSKQSRARRSGLLHWCSLKRSQLLPSGMAVCVLRRLLIEMGKKCGMWFNKEKKEEMCTLRYHCIPFQSQQIACAVRGRPFGGAGWDMWLYLWIRRSSTGRNPQLGFWFGCSMQWLEQ